MMMLNKQAQYSASDPVDLSLRHSQRWMDGAHLEMNGHMENGSCEIVDASRSTHIATINGIEQQQFCGLATRPELLQWVSTSWI
jgi:hypothetical protein